MHVLVLGKGGREHALCCLLSKSDKITKLFSLNGNPGIQKITTPLNGPEDNASILTLCKNHKIDVVIPGGESYLAAGISDYLTPHGILVFGPSKKASTIEGSKAFAKNLMKKYAIPTANYETFESYEAALDYLNQKKPPYVIKYDGLALGKGVYILDHLHDAKTILDKIFLQGEYETSKVVIEDFLVGKEFSFIAMVHEDMVVPLPLAKDYKRRFDQDDGPNTGGMGAFSPVPFVTDKVYHESLKIMQKTVHALSKEGISYTGFLYGGFILTEDGPQVIEFNCRLGDPETEVILPRIQSDFFDAIMKLMHREEVNLLVDPQTHLGVVIVAEDYPDQYQKHIPLHTLKIDNNMLYHMGTTTQDKALVSSGGRVLFVRSTGNSLKAAQENAYKALDKLSLKGLAYRKDIGNY